jgi:hypothetical protein
MDFSNHDELSQVEAALRSERPRLGGDIESAICGRVGSGRSGGGRRMSLAVILSVGTLGAMSAFGGVGYANFGFHLNPLYSSHHSPFKDQYGKGPKSHPGHNVLQDLLYWLMHHHH